MSCRPVTRWMFGKLPALGDFVSRGLDFPLRDSLDDWLSSEMAAALGRFPEDFEERYFAAPAWSFVDCDNQGQWSGGALCASVDAVGRKFPVMAAASSEDVESASVMAGACLDILHHALAEGWDADAVQLSALEPAELPWQPQAPEWALIGEDGPGLIKPGRFPQGIIMAMMEMAA
jgi:type VI secretion system ImpM family protein